MLFCVLLCTNVLIRKGVRLTSNSSCQAAGVDELSIFRVCLAGETLDWRTAGVVLLKQQVKKDNGHCSSSLLHLEYNNHFWISKQQSLLDIKTLQHYITLLHYSYTKSVASIASNRLFQQWSVFHINILLIDYWMERCSDRGLPTHWELMIRMFEQLPYTCAWETTF